MKRDANFVNGVLQYRTGVAGGRTSDGDSSVGGPRDRDPARPVRRAPRARRDRGRRRGSASPSRPRTPCCARSRPSSWWSQDHDTGKYRPRPGAAGTGQRLPGDARAAGPLGGLGRLAGHPGQRGGLGGRAQRRPRAGRAPRVPARGRGADPRGRRRAAVAHVRAGQGDRRAPARVRPGPAAGRRAAGAHRRHDHRPGGARRRAGRAPGAPGTPSRTARRRSATRASPRRCSTATAWSGAIGLVGPVERLLTGPRDESDAITVTGAASGGGRASDDHAVAVRETARLLSRDLGAGRPTPRRFIAEAS